MAAKKKLKLEGGQFVRDPKEDAETLTVAYCQERADVCLAEAARSQVPNSTEYTRQAEVWIALAATLKN